MRAIAIYDLDRTVTLRPTFTPFLAFAARRRAPWRLAFAPIWLLALIGYKLKLYPREPLKAFGLTLFVGRRVPPAIMDDLASAFTEQTCAQNIAPGARRAMAADRERGATLLLVTAAPELYAVPVARALGFADCIATRHRRTAAGDWCALIDGANNYGAEKRRRVEDWLSRQGLKREDVHITAYSDHSSDAPLFDWADDAVLIGPYHAAKSGWRVEDWRA